MQPRPTNNTTACICHAASLPAACSVLALVLQRDVLGGRLEARVDLAEDAQRLRVQPPAGHGVVGRRRVGVLLGVRIEGVDQAQLGRADVPPGLACMPCTGSLQTHSGLPVEPYSSLRKRCNRFTRPISGKPLVHPDLPACPSNAECESMHVVADWLDSVSVSADRTDQARLRQADLPPPPDLSACASKFCSSI